MKTQRSLGRHFSGCVAARRHASAQALVFACLFLASSACGNAATPTDASVGAADAARDAAELADAAHDAAPLIDVPAVDAPVADAWPATDAGQAIVQIGGLDASSSFVAWHDDQTIPLVHGPQGGVMVTPNIAIDGALVAGDSPMLELTLTNLAEPGLEPLPDFPGIGPVTYPFTRIGSQLVSGQLYDQLSWAEMPGQALLLRVHVTGPGLDAVGEVRIVTGPSTGP